jgi:hypothetical protein
MKHLIIPDTQVKPNTPIDHLKWAGQYAVKMRPDVIVHIGDHWDMESLSSYDKGKKSFEGRRYTKDIEAGIVGMEAFLKPIRDEQSRLRRNKEKQWNPRLVFTLGNHENRIARAIDDDPMLDGLIGFKDFKLEEMGWEVYGFLECVVIDNIAYQHYFTSGIMGRPVANPTAMLNKMHMSTVQGHVQDRGISFARRADGRQMIGIFAGIFYQHEESYLTPHNNLSWRGVWMLHEVLDGSADIMMVSLEFLKSKYGESK